MARKYNRTKELANYVGRRYSKLTVIENIEPNLGPSNKGGLWRCLCECGNFKEVRGYNLKLIKSCGCLLLEHLNVLAINHRTYDKNTVNVQYSQHKSSAKLRNLVPLNRTEWENIVFKPCYYCGQLDIRNRATSQAYRKKAGATLREEQICKYNVSINGIDRINSNLGYTVENSVSCCDMCNKMKNKYSLDEFINHIKLIVNKFK